MDSTGEPKCGGGKSVTVAIGLAAELVIGSATLVLDALPSITEVRKRHSNIVASFWTVVIAAIPALPMFANRWCLAYGSVMLTCVCFPERGFPSFDIRAPDRGKRSRRKVNVGGQS
jgi:hypothetical protein